MLMSGTTSVTNTAAQGADASNNNILAVFENCVTFTDCISKINNTQINNAKYIDVVMSMYDLIEYSDNYSKTSGSLWQYYWDKSAQWLILAMLIIFLVIVLCLNLNKK